MLCYVHFWTMFTFIKTHPKIFKMINSCLSICNLGAFWGKPLRPQGRSHLGSPGIPVYDHEPVPWFPIDAHNPHPPYPLPVSSLSRETESERKINYALIIRFQFGIKRQENEFSYAITRLIFDACHISWVHFIPMHSTKWMVI